MWCPASEGHILVIAKNHAPTLLEIAEADLLAATVTTQRIARASQQALAADGLRISQFNGRCRRPERAALSRSHRADCEGQRAGSHGREKADSAALETVAARIRHALT